MHFDDMFAALFCFLGMVMLPAGLIIWIGSRRTLDRIQRYEFEHTTGAGVVSFADYGASKRHKRSRWLAESGIKLGKGLIAAAIFFFLGWLGFRHPSR